MRLSSPSNLTMGWPPCSFSTRFWGRNRATTLMVFPLDMVALEMMRSEWLWSISSTKECGRPQVAAEGVWEWEWE